MSLVEFFFNSDYRESLQVNKIISNVDTVIETKEQAEKRKSKFWRDYHLGKMRHEIKLLNSEIIYGFINKNIVTRDKFEIFLNNRGAKSWVIPVLWDEFKNNKYTNNGNKTI